MPYPTVRPPALHPEQALLSDSYALRREIPITRSKLLIKTLTLKKMVMTEQAVVALNWIDGEWTSSATISTSIDPATYEKIGTYASGGIEAAQAAIAAAKRAFQETPWKRDHHLRAKVINQLADSFERHRDELVDLLALENGKVKAEAAFEVDMVPSKLRFYASLVRTESGRAVEPKPGSLSIILRQAMGVAGVIAPWNSPVVLMIRSLAPALHHRYQDAGAVGAGGGAHLQNHGRGPGFAEGRYQPLQ